MAIEYIYECEAGHKTMIVAEVNLVGTEAPPTVECQEPKCKKEARIVGAQNHPVWADTQE